MLIDSTQLTIKVQKRLMEQLQMVEGMIYEEFIDK